jgi:hypothetical protein
VDYSIRQEEGLLLVDMSGNPSIEHLRAMFEEMLRHGEFRRALLVMRTAYCLSLPDTMELVRRISSQFAEDVAVNRGIALHSFSERDKARSWLILP